MARKRGKIRAREPQKRKRRTVDGFDEQKERWKLEQEGNGGKTVAMGTETSRGLDKREVSRIVFFWPRYSASIRSVKLLAPEKEREYYFPEVSSCNFQRKYIEGSLKCSNRSGVGFNSSLFASALFVNGYFDISDNESLLIDIVIVLRKNRNMDRVPDSWIVSLVIQSRVGSDWNFLCTILERNISGLLNFTLCWLLNEANVALITTRISRET